MSLDSVGDDHVIVEGVITLQSLVPLFRELACLHCELDHIVHYQQMCGTSSAGWKEMYD